MFGPNKSFEICDCECHNTDPLALTVNHFAPCCAGQCPRCKQHITHFYYDEHVKKCEREYQDIFNRVQKET